jgi:hypothetical protein
MSALIAFTAALAAQTTTPTSSTPATTPSEARPKAGETTYIDIEAGVGYSTNPQLSLNSDNGRAFGRVSAHAVYSRLSERSTTVLSAFAQNLTYTSRYGSQQSLSVDARHDTAVNERLRLFADASAGYDEGGQLDTRILSVPDVPPPPGTPGTPPVLLPPGSDFLSVTGKYYRFAAHGGGSLALSAIDSLTFNTGIERAVFRSRLQDSDYWTIPASIGYDRQISPRTHVGARVAYQHTDYNGPANFRMVTPQATLNVLLTERMTFNASAGVSFARVDDGTAVHRSTGADAEATLCNRGETSNFCARAGVHQQIATTAGPAKSVNLGVDYSHRIDADSSIQFSLEGSHYSAPISVITGHTFSRSNYYRAAADYTRRLGSRWFGGVNLAARKLTEAGPDPDTDFSGSLFIRYRFGDAR